MQAFVSISKSINRPHLTLKQEDLLSQKIHKYPIAKPWANAYIIRMKTQKEHVEKHGYHNHWLPTLTKEQALAIAMDKIERAFGSKK